MKCPINQTSSIKDPLNQHHEQTKQRCHQSMPFALVPRQNPIIDLEKIALRS